MLDIYLPLFLKHSLELGWTSNGRCKKEGWNGKTIHLSVRLIMHVHVIEGNWQIAVNLIAHNYSDESSNS